MSMDAMDGWMDGWMVCWMDGWMDGWINGWMVGRAHRHIRVTHTVYLHVSAASIIPQLRPQVNHRPVASDIEGHGRITAAHVANSTRSA
jgi:hypothetical protein